MNFNLGINVAPNTAEGEGPAGPAGPAGPTGPAGPAGVGPTGSIIMFGGSTAPTGWLLCNGDMITQAAYAALYAVIGYTYSADPAGGSTMTDLNPTYGFSSNQITLSATGNPFVTVGMTAMIGGAPPNPGTPDLQGLPFLVTTAPPPGEPGTIIGEFVTPVAGTGSGTGGSYVLTRLSFQVPNTLAKTIRGVGADGAYPLGSSGGVENVTLGPTNVPPHVHKLASIGPNSALFSGGGGDGSVDNNGSNDPQLFSSNDIYNGANELVTASGANPASFSVVNTYIAFNYIIKT